ncbi:hypothetical protein DEU56DRAFT_796766 [Suillus clintonianus]|uniref:uncharacterized protein n=1 Tax=Suillus clintonianus TaxID=1904413 RepID=UPI001B87ED81|nr:uncharacterized protein DEU56DRAFT_796766 [Suillus clintonianus]KAG2141027.1 hypothetical protein DEU56DRAFT_796766 [Suillus clintonianus]
MSFSNLFGSLAVDMDGDEKQQEEHVTKKIKITANNGWEHVLARGGIKSRFTKITTTQATEHLKNYRPRAQRQNLEILISLPLDILFEIFGRLLPLDLLHLARTSKALRGVLMHRSSTTVWMAARSNVKGMPLCADDMSEPAHASLAFDTHCHNCLKPNVRNVDWNLRVRYCQKCFKECTEIIDDKFKKGYGLKLHQCLSLSMTHNRNDIRCLKSDREALVNELLSLGPEERSVLRGKRRDETLIRKEHAILCNKWTDGEQQNRWKELDQLRSLRYDAIVEKLTEVGWGEDIAKLPDRHTARIYKLTHIDDHPLVKQPKPLTDRIWQNIQPKMVEFMGQMREFRIQQERKQQIRERQSLVATIYSDWQREKGYHRFLMPTAADLFRMPRVRNIAELPAHMTVTAEDFQPIREELFDMVDAWKRRTRDDLRSDLPWQLDIPYWVDLSVDCEGLAIAVFTCTEWLCEDISEPNDSPRYMYFPEYLHHRCNRIRRRKWDELDPANTLAMGQGYPGSTVQREWSMDGLEIDKKASRTVRNILDACNLNWRETTVLQLDNLDPRLVCLKCSYGNLCDGERPMIVRSWRESVKHCAKKHWSDSSVKWQKISDEETKSLRQDQEQAAASTTPPLRKIWRCTHCHNKPREPEKMTAQEMTDHLEDHHSMDPVDQVAGKDYVQALDVPPIAIPSVKLKPKAVDPPPFKYGVSTSSRPSFWDRFLSP